MYRNSILFICFVLVLGVSGIALGDLVAHWPLDEGSGTTAYDSAGSNDGTLMSGPVWVTGRIGGGLQFNGSSYVDCGNHTSLNITSTITLAVWVNTNDSGNDEHNPYLAKGDTSYAIKHQLGNNIEYFIFDDTWHTARFPVDNTFNGDWHHLAGTYDGSNLRLYVDGDLKDTVAHVGAIATNNYNVNIGRNSEQIGRFYNGIIDDARIYNHVLTQTEIQELMAGRMAHSPDPAHLAVDVPVDANLSWSRGAGAVQEEVYFGTDPCALPKVTDIVILPINPAFYDPPGDLVASTTYYWQIVEVNGIDRFESPVWEFTTVRGEAQPDYPYDGAIISGDEIEYPQNSDNWYIWTKLSFIPGETTVTFKGYFNEDYSKVESRHPDANLGPPPYASIPGWEYSFFAGNPQVPPAIDSLVRGKRYYWAVDSNDASGNTFGSDVWEFAIQSLYAFAPSPPNEAIYVSTAPFLSWLPGFGVEDHEIYMGTSWEDVNNAVYDYMNLPPEFVTARSEPNYQVVTALPHSTKIYWRVDEVQGRAPPFFIASELYKGDVWEFTTLPEGVGQIREDLWWNLTTSDSANRNSLSWLYNDPNFPGQPDETRMLDSFNSGTGLGDDYGGMIHGWLHPAYSGDYTFWLAPTTMRNYF